MPPSSALPKPNHIRITVVSARNLISKGKNGKNDAFVIVQCDGEKVRTSVKPKSATPLWSEEFELYLQTPYAVLSITVLHQNFLGFDQFLGQINFPVDEIYEVNQYPRNRWYPLKGRSGKSDEHKYRGELELRLEFFYRPLEESFTNSASQLHKSHNVSISNFRTAASTLFNARKESSTMMDSTSDVPNNRFESLPNLRKSSMYNDEGTTSNSHHRDFDLVRDAEESCSSQDEKSPSTGRASLQREHNGAFSVVPNKNPWSSPDLVPQYAANSQDISIVKGLQAKLLRSSVGGDIDWKLAKEMLTKEELVDVIRQQRADITDKSRRIRELEDYIDQLIVRILEFNPTILHAPVLRKPAFRL